MLYDPKRNGTTVVQGRALAHRKHRKLTASQRAVLAADLVRGDATLRPSIAQAATLAGVSTSYVRLALKITPPQRCIIEQYGASLHPMQPRNELPHLALTWNRASADERAAFVKAVGPEQVFSTIAGVL
jgi:hypothetical protein